MLHYGVTLGRMMTVLRVEFRTSFPLFLTFRNNEKWFYNDSALLESFSQQFTKKIDNIHPEDGDYPSSRCGKMDNGDKRWIIETSELSVLSDR